MFWMSEENDLNIWIPKILEHCYLGCLKRLIYCVQQQTLLNWKFRNGLEISKGNKTSSVVAPRGWFISVHYESNNFYNILKTAMKCTYTYSYSTTRMSNRVLSHVMASIFSDNFFKQRPIHFGVTNKQLCTRYKSILSCISIK